MAGPHRARGSLLEPERRGAHPWGLLAFAGSRAAVSGFSGRLPTGRAGPITRDELAEGIAALAQRSRPARKTIAQKRITGGTLERDRLLYPEAAALSPPRTRGECVDGPRPCPWVGCRHHLYLDVDEKTGAIRLHDPDVEPWDMVMTCALDIADAVEGTGLSLHDTGTVLGLTRERIRQIEQRALQRANKRLRRLLPREPDVPGPAPHSRFRTDGETMVAAGRVIPR